MALSVYKRGDFYWVRGRLGVRTVRCSLGTRNREVAHQRAAAMELGHDRGVGSLSLDQFAGRFLAGYSGGSRHNLQGLFCRLLDYFAEHPDRPGRRFLHEITLADLEGYLAGRAIGNNTRRREIQYLRRIWAYAVDHELAPRNLASKLRMPEELPAETQPFTCEEVGRLWRAVDQLERYPELADRLGDTQARLRAQLAVLLDTGIRGSDLVHLRPEHIVDGHLLLRTQKRKTQVRIPLTRTVLRALEDVPPTAAGYYFWTGEGRWQTARANLHRTFQRLGRRAAVAHCHPHRCRDTFSVNLLLAGADIRIVSKLLGHTSLRTTEKHYAPWVQGFQDQAAAAIRAAERLGRPQPARPAGKPRRRRPAKKAAR